MLLQHTAPVNLFVAEVVHVGYWYDLKHARIWSFWKFMLAQMVLSLLIVNSRSKNVHKIRTKIQKILSIDTLFGLGPGSNLLHLSVICYSCWEESVTRHVSEIINPVTKFPNCDHHDIMWTNDDLLSFGLLWTNFSEFLIKNTTTFFLLNGFECHL